MDNTIIVALISFLGTLLGTLGGIVASSKLTNYRLEQLEKRVDAHNLVTCRIPVIEERQNGMETRLLHLENGGIMYEGFKVNNRQNDNACHCSDKSYT